MPARIIAVYTAVAAFFHLKPQLKNEDMEGRIIKAIDLSHQSWIEKGWVEEKPTKV